jgi:hypothetical protein
LSSRHTDPTSTQASRSFNQLLILRHFALEMTVRVQRELTRARLELERRSLVLCDPFLRAVESDSTPSQLMINQCPDSFHLKRCDRRQPSVDVELLRRLRVSRALEPPPAPLADPGRSMIQNSELIDHCCLKVLQGGSSFSTLRRRAGSPSQAPQPRGPSPTLNFEYPQSTRFKLSLHLKLAIPRTCSFAALQTSAHLTHPRKEGGEMSGLGVDFLDCRVAQSEYHLRCGP